MKALQKKLTQFNVPQNLTKIGMYPFYQIIGEGGLSTEVFIKGNKKIMFGSNSYLGLTNHPDIIYAAQNALKNYGTGASGSRLMNGNFDLHEELEDKLAKYVNKPAVAVFSTGFQANLGAISCLMGRNDYIVIDETNHASIIEGCRLSFAKTLKYKHNDMQSLEKVLQNTDSSQITLIIVDGIFSMEGDIARLDKIAELAEKYSASIMVDDAHAIGVIGENGSGTASHFNLTDKVDIIMGTFSKSLASLGGFIASDEETINFIKHKARSLLFSASIPPASAATVIAALDVIHKEPERIDNLWENTKYAKKCFDQEGFRTGNSETPIIPIKIGNDLNTFKYFNILFNNGIYINPIVHPAVEANDSMLRFSLMATHTREQIDFAIENIVKCRKIIENNSIAS
ncbi:MAG: 8-amino-7-oxononanoate synthase [Bacteroidetes bacterium GWE2_29_8]|nr:MAG: 8-amino-7-oxononanoate synthase [Bacteroidetes bacterium GWE2_29_8]